MLPKVYFYPLKSKKALKNSKFFNAFLTRSIFHRESWYTRRESNPNLRLRRPPFYPLYYECMHTQALPRACRFIITDFCKKDKENHSPE